MLTKKMVCENCVNHCRLTVTYGDDYKISDVDGNSCSYGIRYAHDNASTYQEVFQGFASLADKPEEKIKVKSSTEVGPDLVQEFERVLEDLQVDLPVTFGQVLIENVADSGIDLLAAQRKS